MKTRLLILSFSILALLLMSVAWKLSAPALPAPSPAGKSHASSAPHAAGRHRAASNGTSGPSSSAALGTVTAKTLLAEFALNKKSDALQRAQALFPQDPDVILVSCLEATSPDSPWLAMLEQRQPWNAVPHLVRAGLYAQQRNLGQLAEELKKVLAKGAIELNSKTREAALIGLVLQQPAGLDVRESIGAFDHNYYTLVDQIRQALTQSPGLFGGELLTADVGLALAAKLRAVDGNTWTHPFMANHLEHELLRGLPPDDLYGTEGMTVAARKQALLAALEQQMSDVQLVGERIWASTANAGMRLQFFLRLRSEGEQAAVDWLRLQYPPPVAAVQGTGG